MSVHEKYTHWYNSVTLATCCEVARLSLSDTHPEDRQQPPKHFGVFGGVGKNMTKYTAARIQLSCI